MQFAKVDLINGKTVWINLDLVLVATFVSDDEENPDNMTDGVWQLQMVPLNKKESAEQVRARARIDRFVRSGDWDKAELEAESLKKDNDSDGLDSSGLIQFRADMGNNASVVEAITGCKLSEN